MVVGVLGWKIKFNPIIQTKLYLSDFVDIIIIIIIIINSIIIIIIDIIVIDIVINIIIIIMIIIIIQYRTMFCNSLVIYLIPVTTAAEMPILEFN